MDLALVEVAIFERKSGNDKEYLLVPHVGGAVAVEQRQVFHVVIDEKRTRVQVERSPGAVTVNRQEWDEERFFAEAERAAAPLRNFASELRRLRQNYSGVTFDFGVSKFGSLIFKKTGSNILEFYLGYGGYVRFRPRNEAGEDNFTNALGEEWGQRYREGLAHLFPERMKKSYPIVNFHSDGAEGVLHLLEEVLKGSASEQVHSRDRA